MGQRSSTETLFGIVAAFIDSRTWTQADLARRLETRTETIRKRLIELQAAGFKLERQDDWPHVYWSVPKTWFPGALAFKEDEVRDLMRLIARAPRGALRTRVIATTIARLQGDSFDTSAIRPAAIADDEEKWLALVEDAAEKKVPLKVRYYTASKSRESWRHISVHRVDVTERTHMVATCHRAKELRRFRLSGVLDAKLDPHETFLPATAAALAKFDRESFGGFRDDGPVVPCAFTVRNPEAAWVARNLPDARIEHEPTDDGMRFQIDTTAVTMLARFVVGLGGVAKAETPALAAEVEQLARASLGQP